MPFKLHILKVDVLKGKAKATGNDYEMTICQGILDTGNSQEICEFTLPRDMPEPKPGQYTAELSPAVERQSKRLYGVLSSLTPARPSAAQS